MMIRAIITDIEGTTTSLSFVKEVLFPYSRSRLAEFVKEHEADDPQVQSLLDEVRRQIGVPAKPDTEEVIGQLLQWHDEDQKITALKALQGLIWLDGYEKGALRGHLYQDVVDNLKGWRAHGIELYVYSSGSVQAQKLLFGHTEFGDLTPLFSGFFDTGVGAKKDEQSYRNIAEQLSYPAEMMLFLSDIEEELDAAKSAGFNTVWLTRDDVPDPNAGHFQVRSFDDIQIGH